MAKVNLMFKRVFSRRQAENCWYSVQIMFFWCLCFWLGTHAQSHRLISNRQNIYNNPCKHTSMECTSKWTFVTKIEKIVFLKHHGLQNRMNKRTIQQFPIDCLKLRFTNKMQSGIWVIKIRIFIITMQSKKKEDIK